MNGLFYSAHEDLMYQMGRLFGTWDFEDITFSNARPIGALSLDNADYLVDVTYRAVTRTVAYKRIDIGSLLKGLPLGLKPLLVPLDASRAQLASAINARYGIPILPEDIHPAQTLAYGIQVIQAAPDSANYVGGLRVLVDRPGGVIVEAVDEPIHSWPLSGNTDSDIGGSPLTAVFDYEVINGKTWAYHATQRLQPLGVDLPCMGEFTLQFKLLVKSHTVDIQGFLSDSTGIADHGDDLKFGSNATGKYYAYVRGVTGYQSHDADGIAINTPVEITVRGTDGKVQMYINGKMYSVITPSAGMLYWTHIGKANEWLGNNLRFADFKYWDHAIDMPVLQVQSVNNIPELLTWGMQPWYLDNSARDSANSNPRNNPGLYTYGIDYSPSTSKLKPYVAAVRPLVVGNQMPRGAYGDNIIYPMRDGDPGTLWTYGSTAQNYVYNLTDGHMVYNGPTKDCHAQVMGRFHGADVPADQWLLDAFWPANSEYDNVMVIKDSLLDTMNRWGAMIMLHYNDEV